MEAEPRHVVEVDPRTDVGKNACRRLRRSGKVPGIVYGLDQPAFPIAVERRRVGEILKLESGRNTILTLALRGGQETRTVMIRDLQRDPVTGDVLHVDFIRLHLERRISVRVPVRLVGTPVGVKNEGGVLDFVHREVEIECLPTQIPEALEVDVSGLHINQHVSVGDLAAATTVRLLDPPETILAVVSPPRAEEAAPAAGEPAAAEAEPEVIGKGKEEGAAEAEKGSGETG